MTTIAASYKEKTIACDRMFYHSGGVSFKGGSKIVAVPAPLSESLFESKQAYMGFAGNADIWGNVVAWLYSPDTKPPKCREIEFLALTEQGIYHGTNLSNWMKIEEPYFAIGSGMHFAIAAMASGKSPIDACRVAGKYDRGTGLGYKEYSIT